MNTLDEKKILEKFDNLTKRDIEALSDWSILSTKIFDAFLFLGSGFYSANGITLLHGKLDRAIHLSGANQQGPINESLRIETEELVKEIAVALTGRNIEFGDKVDYPGNKKVPHPLVTLEFIRQSKER